MLNRWLQRRRERKAVAYLSTGLAAYAAECVRKRAEAGILCPMQTPGCEYTDCGRWPGGECQGARPPRDRYGCVAHDTYMGL
jgi:hypothetical protein